MWPFDYFRAQSAGHRLQQALFEQSIQMFNANTMPGDFQRDAAAWAQTYETLTDQPVVLSESQHRDVQLRAYRFYKYNPWARGVVSSFRKYIYGLGSLVVIGDKSLQEKWDRWAKACNWNGRVRDLITRTFRDGEAFMRRFAPIYGGDPMHRFIAPYLVRDPDPNSDRRKTYGIETQPNDVETPVAYYVVTEKNRSMLRDGAPIPASEILHIKIGVDAEIKRGETILLPAFWVLPHLKNIMLNRQMLHEIRTALAVVQTVKGGPSAVQAEQAAQRKRSGDTGDTSRTRAWKPGTVIYGPPGVEIEFKNPNLQASDAYSDIRLFVLAICAGTELAEFMVSADASNANYASTLVSEGPAVRAIQDWQDFFDSPIEHEVRWVLSQLAGVSVWDLRDLPIDNQWPPIVHREILDETKAISLQRADGLVSTETARARLGYQHQEEEERLRNEMAGAGVE